MIRRDVSRPKRLAVLIPSLDGGGAERVAVNLLHGFVEAGFEVDLLLVHRKGPLLADVPETVQIIELNGGRIIATLPSLVGYLRRRRPDALLSHLDTLNLVAVWARSISRVATRVVLTTHVVLSRHANNGSWRQRVASRLVRWTYPRADGIVGVSRGVVEDLQRQLGPAQVPLRVIYNPIVSEELRRRSAMLSGQGVTLADLPWPAGHTEPNSARRLVLSVGRLTPQKNQVLLLDAFARLAVREPELHLAILGEGRDRAALERKIETLGLTGRVTLAGYVSDPGPWYAAADVFVLSSRWEGFGNVLIEALLHGCPVVSTRCPSGPDEILEDGRYGRLVPTGDAAALAEAIRQTLAAPPDPEPLRRRALEFGFDPAVREYVAVLFPEDEA